MKSSLLLAVVLTVASSSVSSSFWYSIVSKNGTRETLYADGRCVTEYLWSDGIYRSTPEQACRAQASMIVVSYGSVKK